MVDNGVNLLTTTSKLAAHTNKIQTPLAKAAIDECIWSECYFCCPRSKECQENTHVMIVGTYPGTTGRSMMILVMNAPSAKRHLSSGGRTFLRNTSDMLMKTFMRKCHLEHPAYIHQVSRMPNPQATRIVLRVLLATAREEEDGKITLLGNQGE